MPENRSSPKRAIILVCALVLSFAVAAFAFISLGTKTDAPKVAQAAPALTSSGLVADVVADDNNLGVADAEVEKTYTRIDVGNLVLIKQKSPDSTLEEVVNLFEDDAPVIIAKCYSVAACLQAREVMEPLAQDDVVQEAFYTVIIEAFDANQPARPGNEGIVYMFALPKCGMDMGAREYTSTGLLETALKWYRALSKDCENKH